MTALLSPEEQWLNEAERLCQAWANAAHAECGDDRDIGEYRRIKSAALAHLRSRPAVVQEPVAWMLRGSKTWVDRVVMTEAEADNSVKTRRDGSIKVALYAAPSPAQKETQ